MIAWITGMGCSDPEVVDRDRDRDGYAAGVDCDDDEPSVHPGAVERCDGVDDDCDGQVDLGAVDAPTWYVDLDGDGFGAGPPRASCPQPEGTVADGTDCDDASVDVHPGAREYCDERDRDCDGDPYADAVDVDTWFEDLDQDGVGGGVGVETCTPAVGWVQPRGDCDDGDPNVNPSRDEVCNGLDDDCDPATVEELLISRGSFVDGRFVAVWNYTGWAGLQPAVDDLLPDQLLEVCPGTYAGFVMDDSFSGGVEVEGLYGAEQTVIEGEVRVEIPSGPSPQLVLRGLTFATTGGGLESGVVVDVDTADLVVEDAVFRGNDDSGLKLPADGVATIARTRFEGNSAPYGGGISSEHFVTLIGADLEFFGNAATDGGGAVFSSGPFTCERCTFEGNSVGGDTQFGSGSAVYSSDALVLADSSFTGNFGGAAVKMATGEAVITDTDFTDNVGTTGGAIHLYWTSGATVTGGAITGNSGTESDAGIYARLSDGYSLQVDGVDFGADSVDDVSLWLASGPEVPYDFDGVSSFVCQDGGCE